jgi:WD40 repeat protein
LNYANGELEQKIDSQIDRVALAGFGSDSNFVIAVGENQVISVFDTESGVLVNSKVDGNCGFMTLSTKGYLLACLAYSGQVMVWDYRSAEQIAEFENSNLQSGGDVLVRGSSSISINPAGDTVGITTPHGEAVLLNISERSQIILETDDVTSLDFDAEGKAVITGHLDGTTRIWDASSGTELITLQSHHGAVLSAHFISEYDRVFTTSADGTARIWNLTPLSLSKQISTNTFISMSKFSHNNRLNALVTSVNSILVWDLENDKNLFTLDGYSDDIVSVEFSYDDKYLVTTSRDDTFTIWDLSNGQAIKTITWHKDDVLAAKFSPDGKTIASVGLDHRAGLWDAKTGNMIHQLIGHEGGIFDVEFNNSGTELLTIDYSGIVRQWSVITGKQIRVYEMEAKGLDNVFNLGYISVTFSEDGNQIVAVGKDEIARVWDANTGEQVVMFWNHPGFTAAIFSPTGDRIATYGEDSVIRIWDISSGNMDMELIGHSGESDSTLSAGLVSIQFSQSGDEFISIGRDDTLRIWDLNKGQNLVTLPIARTYSASVSSDGLQVGAYDHSGNFNILNIGYDELVKLLKVRLETLGYTTQ